MTIPGRIHKLAVVCKDVYSLNDINDAFIFAGADLNWLGNPPQHETGQRVGRVYAWVEGIKRDAPDALTRILTGVARGLADHDGVSEADRKYLRREFQLATDPSVSRVDSEPSIFPQSGYDVIEQVVSKLARAIHPLRHRRKGLASLRFDNEYDLQDLLHAVLRPWIFDIRPEEYTPSYAGTSARVDFLLPKYNLILEVKYVRDGGHARTVGNEVILDISHYRVHPLCLHLWVIIYDPHGLVKNPAGLQSMEDDHALREKSIAVRIFYLGL